MNPISHKQAQDWLQNRLDGQIDGTQAAALELHLKDCAACQGYAARLERLDHSLRQGYRARAQSRQIALRQNPLPDGAFAKLQDKMRLKMKSKQVLKFANSTVFIAAMLVLALGFSWLISTQGKVKLPELPGNPASAPAAALPASWTKETPLTDPVQIAATMDSLAQKNVNAFKQAGWVHVTRQDSGQKGVSPATFSDGWFQYTSEPQLCLAGMEVISKLPGGTPLQILVTRAGGTNGDLVVLRTGIGKVTHLKPGDNGCSLTPEFTYAGQFAARLKAEQAASAGKMDARAWYETAQGRTRFVVAATFSAHSGANQTSAARETQSYEVENGMLVESAALMDGQADPRSQVYVTEFVPLLPAEAAAQWKEFSGELQVYVIQP